MSMFFKMIFETWKLLDHLNMTFAYRSLSQVMFFPLQKTTTPTEGEQSQHLQWESKNMQTFDQQCLGCGRHTQNCTGAYNKINHF